MNHSLHIGIEWSYFYSVFNFNFYDFFFFYQNWFTVKNCREPTQTHSRWAKFDSPVDDVCIRDLVMVQTSLPPLSPTRPETIFARHAFIITKITIMYMTMCTRISLASALGTSAPQHFSDTIIFYILKCFTTIVGGGDARWVPHDKI